MRWIVIALSALLGLAWSRTAQAWGDDGHRLVCEIAYQRLTPTARREVNRLLTANPAIQAVQPLGNQLGWACTYPDHPGAGGYGRRLSDHYVNYPRSLAVVGANSGCGLAATCILTAIARDQRILRSATQSDAERGWALVYLGHWLGDIHQPLHVAYDDDKGGVEVRTSGTACRNVLHSAWDFCILSTHYFPGTDQDNPPTVQAVRGLATAWNREITAVQQARWLKARPWQWAAESNRYARTALMQYCFMGRGGCRYSASFLTWAEGRTESRPVVAIDGSYTRWALPIIRERIKQAGVRLANMLNRSLDPAYRP